MSVTCPDREPSDSFKRKHPSVTPEGFVLVGGLGSFQQKGNYIFWESLPAMVRASSVALGQM